MDIPIENLYCVLMDDFIHGAPDGKTFGEVVIVGPEDIRIGTVSASGASFGSKSLKVTLINPFDTDLILTDPPEGFTNPLCVNQCYRVVGFQPGDVIPPGGTRSGLVIFMPTYRGGQEGGIIFFTNHGPMEDGIPNMSGQGVVPARAYHLPANLELPMTPANTTSEGVFTLINVGDRPLQVIDCLSDNPAFNAILGGRPIVVPPETKGGMKGVPVKISFYPKTPGNFIGKLIFNFVQGDLGTTAKRVLNVSGIAV